MTETQKKPRPVMAPLMELFTRHLNKEFTTDSLVALLGCNPTSIPPSMRRLRASGWDVIRSGRGRYMCRATGSYNPDSSCSEELPFIPKQAALKEAKEATAPPTPAATPSGINVGDLLEVSHVTRQGIMVAMDATGNVYRVQPL